MTKFHINKHGVPAPCRAKKGNCPLGGDDTHFDNEVDAQAYADSINSEEFGALPGINKGGVPYEEFTKGDLQTLKDSHVDVEYDGKEFSGKVIGVHLEDNGSERNGLIIQDEDGNVKHIKVNRLESIEENRKVGEEYEVPHAENEDGTYDFDTYTLSAIKEYDGKKVYVYEDERGYPYMISSENGKVDWEAVESFNQAYEEDYKMLDKLPDYGSGISGPSTLSESGHEIGKKFVANLNEEINPELPKLKGYYRKASFRSIDDLETLIHTRGEFITSNEHNPVALVQSQFDHVAGFAGKLYRYKDEGNYLETHGYDFNRSISEYRDYLEKDGYLNPESYGKYAFYGKHPVEAFEADIAKHRSMHNYTAQLAIEYAKDYEKKVVLSGNNYSYEKQEEIKQEYKKALADRIGEFVENYGDESYDEEFKEYEW